ncbi:MAG: restriction endonuclease subunit S [Anaerolineae bacterium]|nr:restriction endonuclease subunit S [Anaerolineae bacterium]
MADSKAKNIAVTMTEEIEHLPARLLEQGWWTSISITSMPSHWMESGEQRLDAGHYANEAFNALHLVHDNPYGFDNLRNLGVTAYHPTQGQARSNFKRIHATKGKGVPFLTASEMYMFRPTPDTFLSRTMAKLDELMVEPNTILLRRSGTVAIPLLASERLSKFALTDDAIRINSGKLYSGYLYAFLASWIGRSLVSKSQYGVTVKHLESAHILSVDCPLLPDDLQKEIHNLIFEAYQIRDHANNLLDEANDILYAELGLPNFDESIVPYLPIPPRLSTHLPEMPHPRAFSVKASELDERFDGSFHVPIAKTAISLLDKGIFPAVRLGEMVNQVYIPPRFKRIYVKKEYGVPFLQGSHLPQTRHYDLKYLSLTNTRKLEQWIIHKGWVLVTCSGTIGRVGLVTSHLDSWAASQHILRIIPDDIKGHSGYILAFLMTPYGQYQLTSKIYGGVVDELTEYDTKQMLIPNAPIELQLKIGKRVVEAFEMRDKATILEAQAIQTLEHTINQ